MKIKHFLILLLTLIVSCCMFLFAACKSSANGSESGSDSGQTSSAEDDETSITVTETATVAEFENVTLVATVKGEGTIKWTSADETVATVENGVVYGVKAGNTTITAAISDKKAVCVVTVTPTHYAHEIVLSQDEVVMSKGKTGSVTASVTFNGSALDVKGLEYEWKPVGNAAEIATVQTADGGATATFTGVGVGEADYDVSTKVRGYEAAERIKIKVIDNVVILDFTNEKFLSGEGIYSLGLTLGSETTDRLEIGTVNVLQDGESKGAAEVSWTVDDNGVVEVENGMIIARKSGYAVVTGTSVYGERTLTAKVGVTVAKGTVTLDVGKTVIETAADTAIKIPEGVDGAVEKITVSGKVVFDGTTACENGYATIITDSMPHEMKDLGKDKTVIIETAEIIYTATADVYTLIINNKEEFDSWQQIACDEAVKAGLCVADAVKQFMSGYFILGNDIAYNATFNPYVTYFNYWSLGHNGVNGVKYGSGEWTDGATYGFKGVFDGCGYTVNGMKISGDFNGFIVTLGGGTIKNVCFTNAAVSGSSSLVVKAGIGTIENVFAQYSEITNTNGAGTFFSTGEDFDRTVKNCVIDVTECNFDSLSNTILIGTDADHSDDGTVYDGVYVVGSYPAGVTLKDKNEGCCVIGAFVSYTALSADKTASAKIAEFDTAFWKVTDSVIIPQKVYEANDFTPAIINEDTDIALGSTVVISANSKFVVYSLKNTVDGITLNGNAISVDESVASGTEITIIVTSLINGKTSENIFVATKNLYALNVAIDMTNDNVSAENAGLSGLWDKNAYLIPEGDANYVSGGTGYEYFLTTDGSASLAGYLSIKEAVKVKNNFNYIRLRMYVKSSGTDAAELRFYRSDRTNHQIDTDVYYDAVANVAVNAWVNVYVPVKSFALNGKINGIKIGAVGQTSVSGIYVDDLTITKVQGTEVSLNGSQIGYPGFGTHWNDGTAVTKDYIELPNGGGYFAAKITFASPVTITTEKSMVITLRTNVKPCRIAIFKHSRTAADALDYYYDDCPANESVTMTVDISQFVENGVLKGFTVALWGDANGVDVTIESVTVV